jgi:hypothetical protein
LALDGRALDGRALDGRALDGRVADATVAAQNLVRPETRAFLSHALLALTVTVVANLRQA